MTRPCCKCSRCGTTFLCTNGEMEDGYCSQHVLDYLFPDICGQRTMTKRGGGGAKRNVPYLLQAQQAPVCLWSISETLHIYIIHIYFNVFFSLLLLQCEFNINLMSLLRFSYLFLPPYDAQASSACSALIKSVECKPHIGGGKR